MLASLLEDDANVHFSETDKACIAFNDVHKDGEHKLILVDFKEQPCRLVLFQVTTTSKTF